MTSENIKTAGICGLIAGIILTWSLAFGAGPVRQSTFKTSEVPRYTFAAVAFYTHGDSVGYQMAWEDTVMPDSIVVTILDKDVPLRVVYER